RILSLSEAKWDEPGDEERPISFRTGGLLRLLQGRRLEAKNDPIYPRRSGAVEPTYSRAWVHPPAAQIAKVDPARCEAPGDEAVHGICDFGTDRPRNADNPLSRHAHFGGQAAFHCGKREISSPSLRGFAAILRYSPGRRGAA